MNDRVVIHLDDEGVADVRLNRADKMNAIDSAMIEGILAAQDRLRATPENEQYLLQIALHGTAHHVETLVRIYRRATEAEELSREHQQQMNRSVHYQWDDDGSLILKAGFPRTLAR